MSFAFNPYVPLLAWPAGIVPSSQTLRLNTNTTRMVSPFSLTTQVQEMPGAQWVLDATFPLLDDEQIQELRAFTAKLRGRTGMFYWKANGASEASIAPQVDAVGEDGGPAMGPDIVATGPRLAECFQGEDLKTQGWPQIVGTVVMRRGDYVSYDDYLGMRHLHLLTADVLVEFGGLATLTVEPPLRIQAPVNGRLHVDCPSGVFRLADDGQLRITETLDGGSVSLSAVEGTSPRLYIAEEPGDYGSTIAAPSLGVTMTHTLMPKGLSGHEYDTIMAYATSTERWTTAWRLAAKETEFIANTSAWASNPTPKLVSDRDIKVAILGTTPFPLSSMTHKTSMLMSVNAVQGAKFRAQKHKGKAFLVVGAEWLYVGNVRQLSNTLLRLDGLQRGAYGTMPEKHISNGPCVLVTDYAVHPTALKTQVKENATTAFLPGPAEVVLRARSIGPGGTLDEDIAAGTQQRWQIDASKPSAARPLRTARLSLNNQLFSTDPDDAPYFLRATHFTISCASRAGLTNTAPFFDPDPFNYLDGGFGGAASTNLKVFMSAEYKTDEGAWVNFYPTSEVLAPEYEQTFSLTGVPAGDRDLRLRMFASKFFPGEPNTILNGPFAYYYAHIGN